MKPTPNGHFPKISMAGSRAKIPMSYFNLNSVLNLPENFDHF